MSLFAFVKAASSLWLPLLQSSLLAVMAILAPLLRVLRPSSSAVAVFHPYSDAGGGGERVLWRAVQVLAVAGFPVVIYSRRPQGGKGGKDILKEARDRFGIQVRDDQVEFVWIWSAWMLSEKWYPMMTMLGQSLGGALVAAEAMLRKRCRVVVDTMGCPFAYPVARLVFGSKVACYTHYPTISSDMLDMVENGSIAYNNSYRIFAYSTLKRLKVYYYKAFSMLYGWAGKCVDCVIVNSTWTYGHIKAQWGRSDIHIVFPPCDTAGLKTFPMENREMQAVSVGQFRPEKNHRLQILALYEYSKLQSVKENPKSMLKLVIVGGARHEEDLQRVEDLKALAQSLGLQDAVSFQVNVSLEKLRAILASSLIGLHTMWNEHFGISVVEMMAAGTIIIANNSGGPRFDIVKQNTGYLASSPEEYAEIMDFIVKHHSDMSSSSKKLLNQIRCAARDHTAEFDDHAFQVKFLNALKEILMQ